MYKTVLLCYDGTAQGRKALREGALLARAMGSKTHLLAICRDLVSASMVPEAVTSTLVECEQQAAQSILAQGVAKLVELGINAEGTLLIGDPLVHIPSFAARVQADLIVIGHRQRGRLARWWSESPQPVLLDRVSCSILIAMNSDEKPAGVAS
jgi:nucleotide-binding universal stress UspA family protein